MACKFLFAAAAACTMLSAASCSRQETMDELTGRVFNVALQQVEMMDTMLAPGRCPKTIGKDGELETSSIWWWCSGFYPGSLWLTYEYTGDPQVKEIAEKRTEDLSELQFRTNDHDVGFQIYCSFGNGYRLTGNEEYKSVICNAAHSLATRFNPLVGCTRSWDPAPDHIMAWKFPVIIDNMMNMELLLAASDMCGDPALRNVALSHADTTMKNHFREDGSSYHLVDYDPLSGKILHQMTVQGFADDSAWARGQAWGLYGFTMMYQYTQEDRYLGHATKIASYLMGRLPEDGVPYWDYDADTLPDDFKDASAAAIMASAFVQLSTFADGKKASEYLSVAERILRTLSSEEYLAKPGTNEGFILKHSVGHRKAGSEVDAPLTYTDYYFLEALLRYRRVCGK